MQFSRIWMPVAGVALVAAAYRAYAWPGVAVVVTGLVMWLLLHFTRTMQVLQRAARRPVGFVDSAVMLNARLQPNKSLLHVRAMTRSLGERVSDGGAQPERFRWTDAGQSHVTAEFAGGKLRTWTLHRPAQDGGP
jgi:hypothetical protein